MKDLLRENAAPLILWGALATSAGLLWGRAGLGWTLLAFVLLQVLA
jgi:hypothetical protein